MNPLAALSIELHASEAQIKFALLAGRFEDYGPVLGGAIVPLLRDTIKTHFATEGDAFGKGWSELAPSTIKERTRLGYGGEHPIMIRTARAVKSLTGKTKDSLVKVSAFALLFGTSVPYGVYHQHIGGDHGKGIVPERQWIPDPLPDVVQDEIKQALRDYLVEGRIRPKE